MKREDAAVRELWVDTESRLAEIWRKPDSGARFGARRLSLLS
jgi:hypothetical protein